MNEQNIKKVPKKFWDFINENKDINQYKPKEKVI